MRLKSHNYLLFAVVFHDGDGLPYKPWDYKILILYQLLHFELYENTIFFFF